MNGEAQELRKLAQRIEQVTRESMVSSIAWEQVCALCDYITLRARVIELEFERAEIQRRWGVPRPEEESHGNR